MLRADVAQEFPFGIVVVSNETISQKLNSSCVFYVGGPLDNQFAGQYKMIGLPPCNRLINDRANENHAGKSWLVRVRPEAHE